jgi:hypothetical protein
MSDQDELEHMVGTVTRLHAGHTTRTHTVYDEIIALLVARGWAQGVARRGRALSLSTAIDEAVGIGSPRGSAPDGATLARAGRIGAHLRDLTGARNLDGWSDEPERTFDDVVRLLSSAAVGFDDD